MKDRIAVPSRLQGRIERLVREHQKGRVETSEEARRAVETAILENGLRALELEQEGSQGLAEDDFPTRRAGAVE